MSPPVPAAQPFAAQRHTLISFKATLPSRFPSPVPGPRGYKPSTGRGSREPAPASPRCTNAPLRLSRFLRQRGSCHRPLWLPHCPYLMFAPIGQFSSNLPKHRDPAMGSNEKGCTQGFAPRRRLPWERGGASTCHRAWESHKLAGTSSPTPQRTGLFPSPYFSAPVNTTINSKLQEADDCVVKGGKHLKMI